ncbi:hypothetical protein ACYATM_03010 [Lactobacillaceae bacterium Scapto_B20]
MKLMYEVIVCKECGEEVPLDKFCAKCGAKFVDCDEKQNVFVSICVNCGSLTPNEEYCSACGFHKSHHQYF